MPSLGAVKGGLLTVSQAAAELGVEECTIRAWLLRRRHLSHVKLGQCVRIPRAEVERFIRENTIPVREVR